MELDRLLWWAALAGCWWYAWTVNQRAQRAPLCNCNEEGSRILARLVLKIDDARRFVGKPEGMTIEAHHNFTCKGRTYRLTAIEVEKHAAERS